MILNKIKKDVNDEFATIKDNLQIHLKPKFDISQTKHFLKTHIPKEIIYKSEILLDTLLNYLMEESRKSIKTADVKLQNDFFDSDFRKRIHEWTNQLENKIKLEPDIVNYSFDPRLKQGFIIAGTTFLIGAGGTATLIPSIIGAIVSGIITVLLSAITFKVAYKKADKKTRESIINEIDEYVKTAEKQILIWLKSVIDAYEIDFNSFCSANGFKVEGDLDEQ